MADNKFKSLVDNPIIKWLGFIFAAIGFLWLVYENFIKIDTPLLQYEVESNIKILAKNESVSALRIMVDTLDINKSGNNISIYKIKVINNGGECITPELYDKGDFGLQIINGELVEYPTQVVASSSHIVERFNEISKFNRKDFIHIPPITLDVNEFYILKFGILHSNEEEPKFNIKGKIINQRVISLVDINKEDIPWATTIFNGGLWIQVQRVIIYGLFLIVFIIIFAVILSYISTQKTKIKRKKVIQQIKKSGIIERNVLHDYIDRGGGYIRNIYIILKMPTNKIIANYSKSIKYTESNYYKMNATQRKFHNNRRKLYLDLVRNGYLNLDGDTISINKTKQESLKRLYDLLEQEKLIKSYNAED
ncbi:MAG: hypothetical protein R3Y59_04925 [bacterium]